MKKRVVLRAVGEVQKVGYRDFVQKIARKLGIVGHVENMRDGSVQIICEGEDAVIGEFQKAINVKIDFIDVNDVKLVETKKATGEFEYFDIKYGSAEEELGERMGAGILYMAATRDEVKASRQDIQVMAGKLDNIANATVKTHEKLDNITNATVTTHEKLESIDNRLGDALTRYDSFGKDMGAIRQDISDMKLLANEIRDFKDIFARYVDYQIAQGKKE